MNQSPQRTAPWATQWQSLVHKESLSKDVFTYRLEYCLIGLIINSVPEGIVDSVVLAFACTNILLEWKTGETTSHQRTKCNAQIVPQIRKGSLGFHQCNPNVSLGSHGQILSQQKVARASWLQQPLIWHKWVHLAVSAQRRKIYYCHHFHVAVSTQALISLAKATLLRSNKTGSQNSSSKPVHGRDAQPKIPVWADCAV